MSPLQGFTPDAPTTTPGILVDCTDFIPYESGMRAAPSGTAYSSALAAECRGAETLTTLDTTRRVYAGTAAGLYELSGTSWTDRSRGGGYTLGAQVQWSFAQFGDTSLAASLDCVIQTSSGAAFSNQATAPQAKIIESVLSSGGGFVMAFNTIDATYGTSPDRWWCSALNDQTSWTPSVATQATTGRLLGSEGPITAAVKLGSDQIVAYKDRALFVGSYSGPPEVWVWRELPGWGASGMNSVVNLGTAHFCVGADDIYIFDGNRPFSVAEGKVRQWFNDNCSGTYRYKTEVHYDRNNELIWICYVSEGSSTGVLDRCLVYQLKTQQWGKSDVTAETAFLFVQPTITFDGDSGTFDSPTDPFDAVSPGNRLMAYFNSSHVLVTLDGTPGASSFTLHDVGDNERVTRLTRAQLQYMTAPTSASLSAFYTMATGAAQGVGDSQSAYDVPASGGNFFPLRQTARWHRLKFNFTGLCRVVSYDAPLYPTGTR